MIQYSCIFCFVDLLQVNCIFLYFKNMLYNFAHFMGF